MAGIESELPPHARGPRWGWVHRVNRVPFYQRLFQGHDGKRQWQQTPKSRVLLIPYSIMLWSGFGGSMYMMTRMLLGHKTWFSKG
ncbi:hypothetical protein LTS18_002398, partial [Coniosporium uncinatum]